MPHILIVDSNPKLQNDRIRTMGYPGLGEGYREVLSSLTPDATFEIIKPYDGEQRPHLAEFDGAVFTGSSVEWNTDDARAAPIASVMRAAFDASLPTIGSCNGLQLAASVLGGQTGASPNGREDGIAHEITLTDAGTAHPMMAGRKDGYIAPCIHRDEVQGLPDGAILLAYNAHCPVQAFAIDQDGVDFWGMQYHPEYELSYVETALIESIGLTSAEAAAKTKGHLDTKQRTTELRNWLNHIR